MRYFVTLDGTTHEVELSAEGVRVDGREVPAELATVRGSPVRHLRLGDRGLLLLATSTDEGWEIRIGGRSRAVTVEDERTRSIRELTGESAASEGPRELRAPMPGLVVRVLVEAGQEVDIGDGLVVMEAMKMENELRAQAPGVVAEVLAGEGETVNQNDVLVTLKGPEQ